MHLEHLRTCLGSADSARPLLQTWSLRDPERGWRNLAHLAETIPLDALREAVTPLGRLLPRCPDPDMALNNLERFLSNPAAAEQLPARLGNRRRTPESLPQRFSTSPYVTDLLGRNPAHLG